MYEPGSPMESVRTSVAPTWLQPFRSTRTLRAAVAGSPVDMTRGSAPNSTNVVTTERPGTTYGCGKSSKSSEAVLIDFRKLRDGAGAEWLTLDSCSRRSTTTRGRGPEL